jgi:hypothetical protein
MSFRAHYDAQLVLVVGMRGLSIVTGVGDADATMLGVAEESVIRGIPVLTEVGSADVTIFGLAEGSFMRAISVVTDVA